MDEFVCLYCLQICVKNMLSCNQIKMLLFNLVVASILIVMPTNSQQFKLFGPGIHPRNVVMPARYFFVNSTDAIKPYSLDLVQSVAVDITGTSYKSRPCRIWTNKIDRKDGTLIVRYKVYESCSDLSINIYFNNKHIKGSPFLFEGPIQPDPCSCPEKDFNHWLNEYGCPLTYSTINQHLRPFPRVDMKVAVKHIIEKYYSPESTSFCHYVVKNNNIHKKCYGKHVGFSMFAENIILFLSRKVVLPNFEMVVNLGDWPLVKKGKVRNPLPMFSWCGSDDTVDIVMPTYDITESTLENMGRVSLDMLSVQAGAEKPWSEREPRAFWRGRDSRIERLTLIDIARAHPDLFNASLTNFFFFRDKQSQYGPKEPHVSFFKFFDYKYQINIDGTVAAYRLPYLLAGGGMVLKQDSPYYEHFYSLLKPWEHFVPVKRDLSDLAEKVRWAINHDDEAQIIAENGKKFAYENLLPEHIICYHAVLFSEWSKRITSEISVDEDMDLVRQPEFACECNKDENHTEL